MIHKAKKKFKNLTILTTSNQGYDGECNDHVIDPRQLLDGEFYQHKGNFYPHKVLESNMIQEE